MTLYWNRLKRIMRGTPGVTTVEIILILVVLVGLVILFKDQIITIAKSIFTNVTKNINKVY